MRATWFALLLAAGLGLVLPGPAHAVDPDEVLPDPALEVRARAISSGLRCLVCQNQSVDDSHATLARDLRVLVRERLKAGDSDAAVERYLQARYGDFVLLKPPFNGGTALLWATPLLVLGLGGGMLVLVARRREPGSLPPLTVGEEAELARLEGDAGRHAP